MARITTIIEVYDANGVLISTNEDTGGSGGSGDVVGPGSATDNAVARFDSTTGKLIQNSSVTASDAGIVGAAGALLSGLTASKAVVTDGSKNLASSSVSSTELGYVAGVTSAIQTQLDAKQAVVSGVDDTEIGYLNGVTSAIQTQLNTKAPSISPSFTTPTLGVASATSISLAGDPSTALQAATKQYVDAVGAGLDPKPSVLCATTANITLSGEQTLDNVLTSTSRVLVKNQSTSAENGIYVSAAGSWTRATDMDSWAEVPGAFCFVEQGSLYADCGFVCTSNAGGTLNSTAIAFSQFSGPGSITAGTGITVTGTQVAQTALATSRAVVTDGSGNYAAATTTATEIGYVNGVTSALQTQLNLKAPLISPAFTTPDLGTPSAGVMTNATGTAASLTAGQATAALGLKSATTTVSVSAATAPTTGQVLTATDSTHATWQTASGGGQSTPAASTTAQWDASVNMSANNFVPGYATTATAAGTTTLTVTSAGTQIFTGVSTQIIVLPVTSTLALGHKFEIINNSVGGSLTVRSSGANNISTIRNGCRTTYTCINTGVTDATGWDYSRTTSVINSATLVSNSLVTISSAGGTNDFALGDTVNYGTSPNSGAIPSYSSQLVLNAANFIPRYTTTATAAGTTTLTSSSNHRQYFTGSTTQTVQLPAVTSTLSTGWAYEIINLSTGALTVNSSGGNLIQTMAPNTSLIVTCILTTGTTAASWNADYKRIKGATQTQISRLRSAATSLTTATTVNVCNTTTKLTLPAGDWLIYGTVAFTAAATTTVSLLNVGISKTSATLPAADTTGVPTSGEYLMTDALPALVLNGDYTMATQPVPVSLTASTDFYLVAQGTFGVSTLSVFGSMHAVPV